MDEKTGKQWNRSYSEVRDGRTFGIKVSDDVEDERSVVLTVCIDDVIIVTQHYTKVSFPNIDNTWYREVGRVHLGFYDSRIVKPEQNEKLPSK